MANYEEKDIVVNEEYAQPVEAEIVEYEAPEAESCEGGGIVKAVVALAALGVGAIALVKNKSKIGAWIDGRKIKRLEKKGYVVYKPEDDACDENDNYSEEAEAEE
jgi:hypothetical protein